MHINEMLAILASMMHIIAFIIYNKQLLSNNNEPNIVTWAIWAFESLFNVASYFVMSGDWIKTLLPTISSLFCIEIFFVALFKGKFGRIGKFDIAALFTGIFAALVWWQFKSATFANLIAQACVAIGFVPTFKSVWKSPKTEKPVVWFVWSFAYIVGLAVVLTRWQSQYQDLVLYVCGIIFHAAVGILALREKEDIV
jgi:hypothetical protein